MGKRLAVLMLVVGAILVGCEPGGGVPITSQELAARETAVAQATREAMDNTARATADALSVQAQATRQVLEAQAQATQQVLDAQATAQAVEATATAAAWAFETTATAAARNVEATATAQAATATAMNLEVQATAQAVEATATAVALEVRRQQVVQPMRTYAPWVLLTLAVGAVGYLFFRLAPVVEERARVIRRRADEGEPLIVWQNRWGLPLRSHGVLIDATPGRERAPRLAPTIEAQEAATMRQQTANAIQARQAAAIARARKGAPVMIAPGVVRGRGVPRQYREAPGLVRVVAVNSLAEAAAQGILPPRLAEAVEARWEVEEEE